MGIHAAMNGLDATLEEVGQVGDAEQIPGLLQRVAERYALKTVAYLGTGTLDRKFPRQEPFIPKFAFVSLTSC
ncbi:hypothetical protein [Mesorhizobium sp. M5C.F.Ca.IN.020.32.2.1]|uniref:hypothetical protein n=1 Tax=Mesorhizobium sp. M5C.F.Ca.IN.020.32.2.1 TaxID=2496771 RepID=UPI000FD61AEB|nr:hypothetical protein [Mesorhizobium sp. M5C.F.Ca.IN.020.32.2.1]RUV30391.1 hypothetical protein EOA86_11310 [Mesorhizobium sp. M5C.F.Ca.IN.020.32.2.1]